MNKPNSVLYEILNPSQKICVVDVGANPIDGDPPYKSLVQLGYCTVIGFEPQEKAFQRLLEMKGESETYLPYAIGDGETHEFHICNGSGMSSFLVPDKEKLALFDVLRNLSEVIETKNISTSRLDDVKEITKMDFLKIDVQGSELSVFRSAKNKLADTVMIQTEVSFITLYEGQPPFGEIDLELRSQGFVPHFSPKLKLWPIAPCIMNNDPRVALNQMLEADIVYMRDITKPDLMTDEQLKNLAIIAHYCYGSVDLSLRCVMLLENRGLLPITSQRKYLDSL